MINILLLKEIIFCDPLLEPFYQNGSKYVSQDTVLQRKLILKIIFIFPFLP